MDKVRTISKKYHHKAAKVKALTHHPAASSLGIALLSLFFLLILIVKNFSAQTADDILRPLLGEKNTLALESVYFNLQDKYNAASYSILGTQSLASLQFSKPAKTMNTDKLNLKNISVDTTLPQLTNEGVWIPINQNLFPHQTIMAKTFIRPDQTHPYAIAYLVQMDMKKLGIGAVAGTYYPGGPHGPGMVPKAIQDAQKLVAVFNGGFQKKDGQYGMQVGDTIYVPLQMHMPTLVIDKNGSAQFEIYTDSKLSSDAAVLRQNGPYLLEDGKITPYVEQGNDTWGRTITNNMYTWRSGIGITKQGNLIYAAGNSLIPQTLAKSLLDAGAINAIQLDINPPWVRFILYQNTPEKQYTFSPLTSDMTGGKEFLQRYNKDFFYIYKR